MYANRSEHLRKLYCSFYSTVFFYFADETTDFDTLFPANAILTIRLIDKISISNFLYSHFCYRNKEFQFRMEEYEQSGKDNSSFS